MPRHTIAFALLLLVPQLGCVSFPFRPAAPPEPEQPVALELPPAQAAEVCLATAREMEKAGNEPEAILQYEKARQNSPKLTQVSRRLAVLYDRQCNYERALAEYRLALQLTPKDADLLNDMGYCHYERGDAVQAEKYLRQAVAVKPDNKRAWVNLGLALGAQGRYPESYEAFARVLSPGEARANVGVLQAQQGRREEARASLRQALELCPELRSARAVLARVEDPRPLEPAARDSRALLTTIQKTPEAAQVSSPGGADGAGHTND
jgi:Tfp pilus assembly protein PilF